MAQQSDAITASPLPVSSATRDAVQKILSDTVANGQAYEYDRHLADDIGPRLTGSANYLQAVQWGEHTFQQLGLTNVHTENFKMDTWEPGPVEKARITSPSIRDLHLWSYGWSPSTPKDGISGEVVYVPDASPAVLAQNADSLRGKILLLGHDSFSKQQHMVDYLRVYEAVMALHPAALLMEGDAKAAARQGDLDWHGKLSPFPVAQISEEDDSLLQRLLNRGSVHIEFAFHNRTAKNVLVPQVVGEIRGTELPDEVVIVGAHLDSWNPGSGAQDNGTGSSEVLEAAREIQNLHRPPRRTVRFILFGGEEQGIVGSVSYSRTHAPEMKSVDAMLCSDSGSGVPRGWFVLSRQDEKTSLQTVQPLLHSVGADGVSNGTPYSFGTDQAGFYAQGVPSLLLWTDTDKYFPLHHTAADTFDAVDKTTLLQGAATITATAYAIADSTGSFAQHATSAQMQKALQDTNMLNLYQLMKADNMMP
jgi:carboxypeptidase Q